MIRLNNLALTTVLVVSCAHVMTQAMNQAPAVAENGPPLTLTDVQKAEEVVSLREADANKAQRLLTALGAGAAIAGVITAALGVLSFFASTNLNHKQEAVNEAQTDLAKARERKFALDLKDRDLAIAQADAKRAELDQWVVGRRLEGEARKRLVAELTPLRGSRFALGFSTNDESSTFAKDLKTAFEEAGWILGTSGSWSGGFFDDYGLKIWIPESVHAAALRATMSVLPSAEIEPENRPGGLRPTDDSALVNVAVHPRPPR